MKMLLCQITEMVDGTVNINRNEEHVVYIFVFVCFRANTVHKKYKYISCPAEGV